MLQSCTSFSLAASVPNVLRMRSMPGSLRIVAA